MALPNDVKDREFQKFVETDDGDVAVRVTGEDLNIGAVEIKDPDSDDRAEVDWDGTYNALAVMDSRLKTDVDDDNIAGSQVLPLDIVLNYGWDSTNSLHKRFKVELDDGTIASGQTTQLVIPLNYYWDDKANAWKRWEGESGSMYTTVVGLYTPSFDSLSDDDADALKVIGQETPIDNYTTPTKAIPTLSANMVYDGTNWDMMRGTSADGLLVNLGSNNDVTVTGSVTASATDLDIRDLTSVSDSVEVLQATASNLKVDLSDTTSNTNALKVDGSAVTQPISGTVTANAGTNLNTSALALDSTLTDKTQMVQITDGTDEVRTHNNMLYIVNDGHLIGMGLVANHIPFLKIGYNPEITNTEEVVWSNGGPYGFSKGEAQLEVQSSDNTQDIGTSIHSGTSTGGSTTTLIDTGADFTSGTAVAVFDTIILDKSGTTPEWGIVTGVTATTLTIAGGFSSGGTGSGRAYEVIDYSAYTGAHAVYVEYLDDEFAEHQEIIVLNGTTSVNTVNTNYYRINNFMVIAVGSGNKPVGNLTIRNLADTPIHAHITAGYTIARQAVYTVPAGKTLYLNSFDVSWATPDDTKVQTARLTIQASFDAQKDFNTGSIFYPYAEMMVSNENARIKNDIPFKVPSGVDIKVVGVSMGTSGRGPATTVLRGWLETT